MLFFLIGNVANFVSLGFASQSMLAACGSMQFITNVFCEWYFKGSPITRRACLALLVIVIGNTLIVAFANHESPTLNVDQLLSGTIQCSTHQIVQSAHISSCTRLYSVLSVACTSSPPTTCTA